MPNLMLTNWCNYKCPYCFGIDFMHPLLPKKNMSMDTFHGIIDWLSITKRDVSTIHLMGGEPTLHPNFEEIVSELLSKDFHITVFSNLATPKAPEYAQKLSDLPIEWVVNVNPPSGWSNEQSERIRSALKVLKNKACITFNIMPDSDDNNWAVDLINQYGLNHSMKIGFVLPTMTGSNFSLEEEQYPVVAEKVVNLARVCEPYHIHFEFECGVPTCAFTEEQLGYLWEVGSKFDSSCNSRLDISPDGECIYCLPLAKLAAVHYTNFLNYFDAKMWFEKKILPYRRLGRIENCHKCVLFKTSCRGGCVAKMVLGAKNVKTNDNER